MNISCKKIKYTIYTHRSSTVSLVALADADASVDHFAGESAALFDSSGHRLDLTVLGQAECQETYGQSAISRDMLCASSSVCPTGSSGAPLVLTQESGQEVQIGVASWGPSSCLPAPEVFADVAYIRTTVDGEGKLQF